MFPSTPPVSTSPPLVRPPTRLALPLFSTLKGFRRDESTDMHLFAGYIVILGSCACELTYERGSACAFCLCLLGVPMALRVAKRIGFNRKLRRHVPECLVWWLRKDNLLVSGGLPLMTAVNLCGKSWFRLARGLFGIFISFPCTPWPNSNRNRNSRQGPDTQLITVNMAYLCLSYSPLLLPRLPNPSSHLSFRLYLLLELKSSISQANMIQLQEAYG